MAEDPKDKKTKREGLSEAAREALDRSNPGKPDTGEVAIEHDAAVLAETKQDHVDTHAAKSTPHGKEDIAEMKKPSPPADSDDEAPLKSFKKIDEDDREV